MNNQLVNTENRITRPPSALSNKDFEQICLERNLVPIELTDRDIIQTVTIRHNIMTGQLECKAEKIGEQVVGLLADAMASMWKYWFKSPLRPKCTSGHARVLLDLDGDVLKIVYGLTDPENPELPPAPDALVAKTMLASALFGLCEKTGDSDFDAMSALIGIKIDNQVIS